MDIKQSKLVTYREGFSSMKSHGHINIWSCENTWQIITSYLYLQKTYERQTKPRGDLPWHAPVLTHMTFLLRDQRVVTWQLEEIISPGY